MLVQKDENRTAQEFKPMLNNAKFKENDPDFAIRDWTNSSKFMFLIEIMNKLKDFNKDRKQEKEKVIIVS